MDLPSLIGVLAWIVVLFFVFWVPSEILRKAGFARGWAFLAVLTNVVGVIIFAFKEWPIHRELGWHRFKAGNTSKENFALAESYAIDLEKNGEWQRAEEVYQELARRAEAGRDVYYLNCMKRLHEKMELVEVTLVQ